MKLAKDEGGFTLIEILVTINLAFLAVAFIVSFYMLINKVVIGTNKKVEERHVTYDFLYRLNESLNKADWYSFQISDTSSQIISNRDTIYFTGGSISGRRIMNVDNIDKYGMKIIFLSGDSLILENGRAADIILPDEIRTYAADSISSISLRLERNRVYNWNIYNKRIPCKRFKNL